MKTGFTKFDEEIGGIPSIGLTLVSSESRDFSFDFLNILMHIFSFEKIHCSFLSFSKDGNNCSKLTDISLENLCNLIEDSCKKGVKVFLIHSLNNIYEEDENDLIYFNSFSNKIKVLHKLAKKLDIAIIAAYDAPSDSIKQKTENDISVSDINFELFLLYDFFSCIIIIQDIKRHWFNYHKYESNIIYASPLKSEDIYSTLGIDQWYWYENTSIVSDEDMLDWGDED